MLSALVCGGHVLLEDVPGTAKTILARAIAGSIDGVEFSRIQCTPDLQPTDATGLSIFDQEHRDVRVPAGPAVRERRARRRDQPGDAEDAVGAARGDGRAPGHGRRRHAAASRPVPADRDREPDRVRGHVPAARGAARPLLPARDARLPGRGGGAADRPRAAARPPARRARRRSSAARRDRRSCAGRPRTSTSTTCSRAWIVAARPHDARARAGRGRRLGARLARAREDRACLGAPARPRPRAPGGRRAALHPRARPPARAAPAYLAETRHLSYGRGARAAPRPRASSSCRRRARTGPASGLAARPRRLVVACAGRTAFPLVPQVPAHRAPVRRRPQRPARPRQRPRRLRGRTCPATRSRRSTGARARGSRPRAATTSSSSASASPTRRPTVVVRRRPPPVDGASTPTGRRGSRSRRRLAPPPRRSSRARSPRAAPSATSTTASVRRRRAVLDLAPRRASPLDPIEDTRARRRLRRAGRLARSGRWSSSRASRGRLARAGHVRLRHLRLPRAPAARRSGSPRRAPLGARARRDPGPDVGAELPVGRPGRPAARRPADRGRCSRCG